MTGPRRVRRPATTGGFYTVELNAVGWTALIGSGLVLGGLVSFATGLSPFTALPASVVTVWIVLLVMDRQRHRNQIIHMGFGKMDAAIGDKVVEQLRGMGIEAAYFETTYDEDDEEGHVTYRGIRCRQADERVTQSVIREHLH